MRVRCSRLALLVLAGLALMFLVTSAIGAPASSWLYILEGTFRQETEYTYRVLLEPAWSVSATLPLLRETAQPWYLVHVEQETVSAAVAPSSEWTEVDDWGNRWQTFFWNQLSERTSFERQALVTSEALYGAIHAYDPYPVERKTASSVPRASLAATSNIQKDAAPIVALAREAVAGCATQLEAVARILAVVADRVVYACSADLCEPVYRIDAVYTLELGKGNCVSYAHLALALLRAAGIPSIAASGFVADREESHAGHAWLSVYFPTWGWVEFESSDWMPAYGETPRTFLMPQHITTYLGDGKGVSSTGFSEEHHVAFVVTRRPERSESARATCRPGETVAWACSLDVPRGDPVTVDLSLSGLPAGWRGTLSAEAVDIDPYASTGAMDILVALSPPPAAKAGDVATVSVQGRSDGIVVGEVLLTVTVAP